MKCQKCQTENLEEAKFCKKCGHALLLTTGSSGDLTNGALLQIPEFSQKSGIDST